MVLVIGVPGSFSSPIQEDRISSAAHLRRQVRSNVLNIEVVCPFCANPKNAKLSLDMFCY